MALAGRRTGIARGAQTTRQAGAEIEAIARRWNVTTWWWATLGGFLFGALVNEFSDLCPWMARGIEQLILRTFAVALTTATKNAASFERARRNPGTPYLGI